MNCIYYNNFGMNLYSESKKLLYKFLVTNFKKRKTKKGGATRYNIQK